MLKMKSITSCTLWNMRVLIKNPRVIIGIILGFLICFFLTQKTIYLADRFDTQVQAFEPFIWSFSDSDSILFSSFALMVMLSQIPRLDNSANILIFKIGKANWLIAQVVTAIVISVGYTALILFSSVVLTIDNNNFVNTWSNTATIMSFAPAEFEVALTVVRKVTKLTTPFECAGFIFLLLTLYSLFLTLLNLFISLKYGKKIGISAVLIFSLILYLLTPDKFAIWFSLPEQVKYYANIISAWFSPLQHATYTMHSFGYDKLPSLTISVIGFITISGLLFLLSFLFVRFKDFDVRGE